MTDKKTEALKLALSVLDEVRSETFRLLRNGQKLYAEQKVWNAIFIIKQALADSALDRMAENARELGLDYEPPCKTGSQCTSKCQQCEQPEQQSHCNDCGGFDPECPLAHPPASKPWVGLTDEEKNQVAWSCGAMSADWLEFADAIEAKLREKNT